MRNRRGGKSGAEARALQRFGGFAADGWSRQRLECVRFTAAFRDVAS